jgi:predicted dehydrogenase
MIGHNYRRKNGIRFIKQLQEDGKIGRPVHLEMVISHGGAFNFPKDSWRNNPQKCFGGPLSMLGSHSFEVLQYLLGKPLSVYSINHCLQSLSTCDDSTISLLQMKCGATAILTHHYIVPSLSYLRIEGTEGTATYEVDSNKVVFLTGRDENCIPAPCHTYSLKPNDDRLEQVIEFAGAINRGIEVETDFSSAYSVVEFIEKSMQSSMSKKVVFF